MLNSTLKLLKFNVNILYFVTDHLITPRTNPNLRQQVLNLAEIKMLEVNPPGNSVVEPGK